MAGNTFGHIFRISTFGESHGPAIGVVIDGCPAGLSVDEGLVNVELSRRRPGQSSITTARKEADQGRILSGVFQGKTLGTPIAILIQNSDARSQDYEHLKDSYRPSHADFTFEAKYGHRDHRGGGRSSARETAARVAAGAVAKVLIKCVGMEIKAYVSQVGAVRLEHGYQALDLDRIEDHITRCPDPETAGRMQALIESIQEQGDTIGGRVTCVVQGVPAGLGEPVFNKLQAALGQAVLSINAVKGFDIGSGFAAIEMRGSQHNDRFELADGEVVTQTNRSGGIQGGISNGMDIYFDVAFKPVATLMSDQASIDRQGKEVMIEGKGRHDPCVVPRAVPIVEAMAALVMADHLLLAQGARVDRIRLDLPDMEESS